MSVSEQLADLIMSLKVADEKATELDDKITELKVERTEFLTKMKTATMAEAKQKIALMQKKLSDVKIELIDEATECGIL